MNSIKAGFAGHGCVDCGTFTNGAIPHGDGLTIVDNLRLAIGGPAQAAALAFKRLGGTAYYFGAVGNDMLSKAQLFMLREAGVSTRHTVRRECCGSGSLIIATPEGRHFLHMPGANNEFDSRRISNKAMGKVQGLYVAGVGLLSRLHGQPLADLLERAKLRGLLTAVDLVQPGAMASGGAFQFIHQALPHVDVLFISLAEALAFTGTRDPNRVIEVLRPAMNSGRSMGTIAVKMGHDGMLLSIPQEETRIVKPYAVEAKDSTGAGDCAGAAFFYALLQGETLEYCAAFAAATGAIVCAKGCGAQGVPPAKKVAAFMNGR